MNKKEKTIVILDAHAIIHRAYHALPAFTTSDGTPTGALYGVITMTLKLIEQFDPTYIVAAFDLPKPTFRHQAYDAYKGTRAKSDDALVTQLQSARELFEAFGIPVRDAEGFEADDVVGTLVETYKKIPHLNIIIASGDMDTLQLVEGEKVQVFTLKKGINDTVVYDETAVRTRYGFSPLQLVDYKGLRGDPSDNIIGVPGIGEKTATTIISTFGSIEGLYKALEKKDEALIKKAGLSPRVQTLLEEHKEDAFFSKTLATIRRDAPVACELSDAEFRARISLVDITALCDRYEFRSLKPRIVKLFSSSEEGEVVQEITQEVVDETLLAQASVALWVLYSEQTNPTYETILQKTKTSSLSEAYTVILEELRKRDLLFVYEHIELPLIPRILEMEAYGIGVDVSYLDTLSAEIEMRLKKIEEDVKVYTNGVEVNLNSPKQLSTFLFETLGLKPKGKRKESGAFTTNAETLEGLRDAHPVIPLILEHRELQKVVSTYGRPLAEHVKEDGRIHARFFQHGTTTGRFSSSDPNLQNIPAGGEWGPKIRRAFKAQDGYVFIGCDYSQIELRVLAMLSGDTTLIDTFTRGEDIHTKVAMEVFGVPKELVTTDMRRSAKVINFGIIYGMGVSALQKNLMTTKEKAQAFYDDYFTAFPTIRAYLESIKHFAREHGYTETLFGRRRYFPLINKGPVYLQSFAERMATNAPIQGTAADIIKIAILAVYAKLSDTEMLPHAHLVLQVHDELVYEVKYEHAEKIKKILVDAMTDIFSFMSSKKEAPRVPLAVSVAEGTYLDELK